MGSPAYPNDRAGNVIQLKDPREDVPQAGGQARVGR